MDPVTLIVTALAAGSSEGALEALKDDVKDAIRVAREVNDAAGKILESGILSPW